ncbi:ester cyclase [Pseudomonas vanderleydeniana]|uniref:Ester cyclase n=1 Tax=Pseudomonas vanderleydeniana TaxID=2745495 RepID=A0A9E6PRM6_9PSED|nr:ester cyclase [Pseudomonas vanderleydeniana]QXI31505.1 ester cyclase [Pseudomonas vanderleydeniana]
MLGAAATPAVAQSDNLVQPAVLVADASLSKQALDAQALAASRYGTFWNTGDEAMARQALAPTFLDKTLPGGRAQGIEGVLAASKAFRSAVPDLHCEIRQMIVAGDRVVTHLHFTGHFTGTLMGKQGQGQDIDFIATDIYRIAKGRIVENWHLEDNLSLLQQAGLAAR